MKFPLNRRRRRRRRRRRFNPPADRPLSFDLHLFSSTPLATFPLDCRRRRTSRRRRRFNQPADRLSEEATADLKGFLPTTGELKAARSAAARVLEELASPSLADPPSAALPALLRRCVRLLPYLDACDKGLAHRCCLRLFDSLRGILSHDPSPSLLPAIEVFLENLDPLWWRFVTGFSAAPEGYGAATHNRHRAFLELACNHFISSLAGEGGSWAFLGALSWSGDESQGAPEICFREVFALLRITRLFSLPGVVEAHLLLLASRCISGPDLDSHLPAFQHFMVLYVDCLPALGVFNGTGGVEALDGKTPLTCCIKEVTHQKLVNQVNGLLSFCQAHVGDGLPISDSDIHDISNRVIEENQHMLHGKFRQEASTVVRSILSKALNCAKQNQVHECDAEMLEEAICLAAVLRLMGSLLVQILHHFSRIGLADDKENANHVALRMAFSIFCDDTIRLLSHYEANELHRCDFISTTGQPVHRERASIQMLAHFASLTVFSVRRRLVFLWRVCIIMMMMAMNLVILEDESMDTFRLLIDASKESADIPDTDKYNLTLALIPETDNGNLQMQVYVRRRSSKAIALQMNALRNRSTEKVDGRVFLQCLPDYNPTCDDDLADFIECEVGKDYSNTLDQLKKFRIFKDEKRSVIVKRRRVGMRGLTWKREDMPRLTWR